MIIDHLYRKRQHTIWRQKILLLLRQKSQRIKIHRLAYRFSIDFYIHTLAYGFFLLEITKIWQKSQDFWFTDFFLQI